MWEREPRAATPVPAGGGGEMFPGAFAALLITLVAIFATAFVVALLGDQSLVTSVGIGEAFGLGGVATWAARRVPEPQAQRLGLRTFDPRLGVALLCLVPVAILISELDNWVRLFVPPSPELVDLASRAGSLAENVSVYASIQTAIVAIGISPVVEGFLFFGVILQGVVAQLGRLRGVLLTCFLYSLVHLPASPTAADAVVPVAAAVIVGALLCLARLATGSVLAPILLAATLAAIGLGALALADHLPIPGFNVPGPHTPFNILLPAAALVLWGASTLRRAALQAPVALPIPDHRHDGDADSDEEFHL